VFNEILIPAMAISLVMGFVVSHNYSLPYTRKGRSGEIRTGENAVKSSE
jgi:hypothetical protein